MNLRSQWFSLLAIFLILASIAYVGYRASATDLETRIHDQLHAIWRLKAKQITAWYLDGWHDATSIAEDADLRDHLRGTLVGSPHARTRLVRTLRSIRREQGFHDIVVLDSARGYVTSASEQRPTQQAMARWSAFLPADSTVVTPLYRQDERTEHPDAAEHADAAERVDGTRLAIDFIGVGHEPDGGIAGYIAIVHDFGREVQELVEFWPTESASGESFLIWREEDHAVYLSNLRFSTRPALSRREPLTHRDIIGVRAVLGDSGMVRGTGYHGNAARAFVGPVSGTPWVLASQVSEEEILAPLRTRMYISLGFVLLLMAITGAGLHIRHNRKQLAEVLARRTAERAFTQALEENEEKYRSLVEFSADAVLINQHDRFVYCNPAMLALRGTRKESDILGYNALIRETCPLAHDGEYAEYFDAVSEGGARLLRTVHSILEIARIQSGTYERLWQDFDIAEMMAGMIDHTRAEARRRGLAFVFLSDQPSMTVRGDVESLRVAIAHLIDNAVKFTERGGIDIRLRQNEEGVVLSISDTGIGMSPDYLARLREPFSQESEGFTKKYQGIGLGMSIAIHHLEANAVRWELRSDVGVGTRIVLHFS